MLERNSRVKEAPERWQETRNNPNLRFDVVITFEERVFDIVIEGISTQYTLHLQLNSMHSLLTLIQLNIQC